MQPPDASNARRLRLLYTVVSPVQGLPAREGYVALEAVAFMQDAASPGVAVVNTLRRGTFRRLTIIESPGPESAPEPPGHEYSSVHESVETDDLPPARPRHPKDYDQHWNSSMA